MKSEKYYAIYLNDYSCPSCTSGTKAYFGTLDEIAYFVGKLKDNSDHADTVSAFEKYCNGQHDVTHGIAYTYHKLMEPVELLAELTMQINDLDWKYINPFGFPYRVRVDNVCGKAILVKHNSRYIR